MILAVLAAPLAGESPPPSRVLVLGSDSAPVRATFVEALRIQLGKRVAVDAGPALAKPALGDRLDEAAAVVEARGALVGVWLERASSADRAGTDFVVYAVGRQRERALIEIARLPAGDEPDIDRALALKVGAFLDTLLVSPAGEANLASTFGTSIRAAPTAPAPAPPPRPAPPFAPPYLAFAGEVGGVAAIGGAASGAQAGLGVAAGARWSGGTWLGEAYGFLRLLSDFTVASSVGNLTVEEQLAGGGARALALLSGRLALGGFVELGARLLDARGTSPLGGSGTAARVVPVTLAGGEARLALGGQLALRAAAGLEVGLRRQSYAIDGNPVSDLGRWRPTASLSLVFSAP